MWRPGGRHRQSGMPLLLHSPLRPPQPRPATLLRCQPHSPSGCRQAVGPLTLISGPAPAPLRAACRSRHHNSGSGSHNSKRAFNPRHGSSAFKSPRWKRRGCPRASGDALLSRRPNGQLCAAPAARASPHAAPLLTPFKTDPRRPPPPSRRRPPQASLCPASTSLASCDAGPSLDTRQPGQRYSK